MKGKKIVTLFPLKEKKITISKKKKVKNFLLKKEEVLC